MLFCQLFLGMGAIGSVPKPEIPEKKNEQWETGQFGCHPIEKILAEETGITDPEAAKPILKEPDSEIFYHR